MTKIKKDNENQEVKKIPRLSPEQYWEWRTTIAEMSIADLKMELERRNVLLAQQDMTIRQYQLMGIKNNLEEASKAYQASKEEYNRFTEKLEKELECSFRNKIVDPITFEVFDGNFSRIPE